MLRASAATLILTLAGLSSFVQHASAQQNQAAEQPALPAWQGFLRTTAGAPIVAAKVRLTAIGSTSPAAPTATGTTAADGQFHLAPLPPGSYHLTVIAEDRTVELAVPVNLTSATAPVVLTLSVRGELSVAQFKTQEATGGEQLSSQAVSELPLNKRDFSTLLLLAAGTMTDANGATNFTAQFAINGQRGVEATFAMDGADISDPEMGGSTFSNFNVDAVEEHRLELRLDAGGDRPGRRGLYQHSHALGGERISRIDLRVCAQLGALMPATSSTTPRRRIPAAFRPFAATSSASRMADRCSCRTSTTAASARSTSFSTRASGRCWEPRR